MTTPAAGGVVVKKMKNNKFGQVLWGLRNLYARVFPGEKSRATLGNFYSEFDHDSAQKLIKQKISSPGPFMAARFGTTELESLAWEFYRRNPLSKYLDFVRHNIAHWDFPRHIYDALENNSGFYPANAGTLGKFYDLYLDDMHEIDILASWQRGEAMFHFAMPQARMILLGDLGPPIGVSEPWTQLLSGKNVLVVHPFDETIRFQYSRREKLFEDPHTLPMFNLTTIKAVQSIAKNRTPFASWFEALDWMKNEMSKVDFDIALIGCGAYGMPLAAHAKRLGKKGIHLGGALQVLFGIRGKRWDENAVSEFYNEHWIRPLESDRPNNYLNVEEGVYW